MKRIFSFIVLLSACFAVYAQEDLSLNSFWKFNGDLSSPLYDYICSHAFTRLTARWSYVDGLKTKDGWMNRQAEAKKVMAEIIGEFPEKTPLNPVITGTIKKDGFVVEKLYFESRPGFYVTAALFLPSGKKGKLPAILFCSGHYINAFRSETYQRNIINLVKKGFAVLAFDPVGQGERIQYLDVNGKSILSPISHEHSYPGVQSFLSGRTPANYFIWDGIRAVDYLISRKEVDAARIGITGQSGGGTQTALIAAMEERIVAAAPECYITSFDKLLRSLGVGDAEQILSLKKGFDQSDLIEIRAPKPTLIVATTQDFFSIQGTHDVFREAQKAYTAFGKPENIILAEDDAEHSCTTKNREAIVAFFQKFLNQPGDPKEAEDIEVLDEKELWATPTGQVITSLNVAETLFSLNGKYTDVVLQKLQSERQDNPDFYKDISKKAMALTGYNEPALSNDYLFSGRLWRDNCSIEKYMVKGPGNYYIPVLRLSTEKNNGKCILLLDDQGKALAAGKGSLSEQLALEGYQVIIPDLNGYGELIGAPKYYGDVNMQGVPVNIWFAGIMAHKNPLAVSMEEIKILVDFIKRTSLSPGEGILTGIACGTLSSDLLHAAVIHKAFDQLVLIHPLFSYQSIVQEKNYHPKYVMSAPAGVIGQYDLPDLVAALSPMKICMVNPINALDQPVDDNLFDQTYREAKQQYGDSRNFSIVFNEKDIFLHVFQWLK